ncbi:MCE family protein [Sporichthya sp.]|uniref:MCE family protein n=1 Tax=Sporichthya sp. TaxID=65475 RepID=UPI0018054586|nr:MCE family protein [Sporichthya sp.]MBA3744408.1 MCE family protein [Sporichthya sp.]
MKLEPSRGDLMVRGVAYLAVMAVAVALVLAQFTGTFTDRVTVTAMLTETGDALIPGSDVKMRGVLVGRVGSIERETGKSGAEVELRLDPGKARDIPAEVTARSLPANFFGQSYVDLVLPAQSAGPIRGGARVPADTSAETVELADVFAKLYRVLSAVEPGKLATVLGALSQALDGRGEAIGNLVGKTDTYLRALAPALPALQADITAFAKFAEDLNRRAPSLLDSVDDVLVLARTLVDRQSQFLDLLGGGLGLTANARKLIGDNEARLIRVSHQTRQIVGVLGAHSDAFSQGFVDLGAFLGGLAADTGRIGIDAQLSGTPLPSYTAADCPRYPGLAGPNCSGGGSGAGDLRTVFYGGIGPVGSVSERVTLAQVLAALEAGLGSSGDIGLLLAGSMLRGQTVVVPDGSR